MSHGRFAGPGVPPRAPDLPRPHPLILELFGDGETWTTSRGLRIPYAVLPDEMLWDLVGYARWHAPTLMGYVGETGDPYLFLARLPAVRTIGRELAHRGELRAPEDLLSVLRASGSVPWERPTSYAALVRETIPAAPLEPSPN